VDRVTHLIGRLGDGLVVRTTSSTYCRTMRVLDPSMSAMAPSVSTMLPLPLPCTVWGEYVCLVVRRETFTESYGEQGKRGRRERDKRWEEERSKIK
jgi:hypothetical protein